MRVGSKEITYDLGVVPDGVGRHALGDQVLQPRFTVRLVV